MYSNLPGLATSLNDAAGLKQVRKAAWLRAQLPWDMTTTTRLTLPLHT